MRRKGKLPRRWASLRRITREVPLPESGIKNAYSKRLGDSRKYWMANFVPSSKDLELSGSVSSRSSTNTVSRFPRTRGSLFFEYRKRWWTILSRAVRVKSVGGLSATWRLELLGKRLRHSGDKAGRTVW